MNERPKINPECAWLKNSCEPCVRDRGSWCIPCQKFFGGTSPMDVKMNKVCRVLHDHWEGPMICGNPLPCRTHGG